MPTPPDRTANVTTADVTVLVVAYAHQDHVQACLESIRQQTVLPSRVIIADDCSPDGTAAAIRDYLAAHEDLDIIAEFVPNESNLGLNPTLNKHLMRVDSTYFTYISADDVMLPERIARHLELMEDIPDAALAYSDAIVIDENGEILHETSKIEFPWPDDPEVRSRPFAELLVRNWMPAASLFLRTAPLQAAGGYREDLFYEDFELLVRLSKGSRFAWTDDALVGVRRLSTSLGSTGFVGTSPRFITALDAALSHYAGAADDLERAAASKRWELAKRAYRSDMNRGESLRMLWASRSGASGPLAVARHLVGWALAPASRRRAG